MYPSLIFCLAFCCSWSATALPQSQQATSSAPASTSSTPAAPRAVSDECADPKRPANIPCGVWLGVSDQAMPLQQDPSLTLSVTPIKAAASISDDEILDTSLLHDALGVLISDVKLFIASGEPYNPNELDLHQVAKSSGSGSVSIKFAQTQDQYANVQPFTLNGLLNLWYTLSEMEAKVSSSLQLKKKDGTVVGQGCVSTASVPDC
ncbi:uncharacterized protein KY384_000055 [Bacidia gigantensis]|uniref:uncharacterized protein n=1 Tax=Bacidia gigantensis TaxID=2732470 RepID=UPI001D0426F5|nr:uncharacterized protein KY384_000055 [Bacidia gigantensis]KAG8526462.1 hypothetical protein KY384_000055 [Bacidia gigantensis]